MKKRICIIGLLILGIMIFGIGITYSFFHSATTSIVDQKIAAFVFNAEKLDHLEIDLANLDPTYAEEYLFSVSNTDLEVTSDVSIEYQMTIKTIHLIPLLIELYKIVDDEEQLILTCDESVSRNEKNELLCNTPIQEMNHSLENADNYKLKVSFMNGYNDEIYSNLVDYIDIEIRSWQNIAE